MILALYWRALTWQGTLAGMFTGAVTVGVWGTMKWFGLYEIVPGFIFALCAAWVVSKLTYRPHPQIDAQFDAAVRLAHASAEQIEAEFGKSPVVSPYRDPAGNVY